MTTSTTAPAAAAQSRAERDTALHDREMKLPAHIADAIRGMAQSSTADVPAEYVPAPHPSAAIVDAWFVETFHGIPLDTVLFNRFHAARERLKAQLAALAKE